MHRLRGFFFGRGGKVTQFWLFRKFSLGPLPFVQECAGPATRLSFPGLLGTTGCPVCFVADVVLDEAVYVAINDLVDRGMLTREVC